MADSKPVDADMRIYEAERISSKVRARIKDVIAQDGDKQWSVMR